MKKKAPLDTNFYEQLRLVESILIPHTHFAIAVSRLEQIIEFARHGVEPRHTLLIGESGTGKTWLAEHVESLFPSYSSPDGLVIPILLVPTPSIPTLKGLAEAILIALGDPLAHRGTAADKRKRALGLMKRCEVILIVLDEFQHFLDHGKFDSLISVSDWLKRFIDDAKVPCLLMGLPRCEAILHVNEQLRRRFSSRLELPPFSIETRQGELEFRSVLKEIDRSLPTERLSGLAEVDLAKRIHFASNGLIGYLRKLITKAFELSASVNRSALDMQLLEEAFLESIWSEGIGKLNPFSSNFEFRRLDRIGEPFGPALTPRDTRRRQTR
jgi:type II secretory pathway predicted ATPase ExeA